MEESIALKRVETLHPKAIWQYVRGQHIVFWFVCGYLLFEYVRPQTIYPWLDVIPWASMLAVLTFLLSFNSKNQAPAVNPIDISFGVFYFVVFLSAVFSFWPSVAFQNYQLALSWVIIYFGIVRVVNTKERFLVFLLLYFLCNFKMSQHGFLVFAKRGFGFTAWGISGSPGWFQNSGEFGIQLCIFVPMVMGFIYGLKHLWNKPTRWILYAMPITGAFCVVGTSSRGALVGLIAAAMWSLKSSKYFFKTVFGIAIVGYVLFTVLPEESKARFQSSGEDKTSSHRLDRWEISWETMKEYPIFGVGYSNWSKYFDNEVYSDVKGSALVHNIFFQAGVETGFTGLFVLLLLILAMFRMNARVRKYCREEDLPFVRPMSHGMDAALIGLIVSASFVTVLWYPYVWIHAAMCSCFYNVYIDKSKLPP